MASGPRRQAPAQGFTLIEALVALAVLAVGFGFGFSSLSEGLGWVDRSETEQAALQVAESTLARVGHDIPLVDGVRDGRAEPGFDWHLETTAYGDAASQLQGRLIGHTVVVTVSWTERRFARRIRLATLRLGAKDRGA
jgi:prepilin-type N-terminal cleavage/methylation domain-containing protein